jgi:putative redox protein
MASATVSIEKSHYKMHVNSGGGNGFIADEPVEVGGENLGFSPDELLCSALGACTAATLRMYADRKQWPLEGVDVEVSFNRQLTSTETNLVRKITFFGSLTDEQKEVMLAIANKCPTHKLLTQPIHIETII